MRRFRRHNTTFIHLPSTPSTATMAGPPTIWYRKFTRSSDPDEDIVATKDFMDANFTDGFGNSLFNQDPSGVYVSSFLTEDDLLKYYSSFAPSVDTSFLIRRPGLCSFANSKI
jgi:hypothetical protein